MATSFLRGKQLGPDDLNMFLEDVNGRPVNAAEISYAIYDYTTGQEVLIGAPQRIPVNPQIGTYYASVVIPLGANLGAYRLRWSFRRTIGKRLYSTVQEFEVIDDAASSSCIQTYDACEKDLIRSLRILLRDNNPDRNYRFRPPAHEETINKFNQVFGYIWEDEELLEYTKRSSDMIAAAPPRTAFLSPRAMLQGYPEWRTLLINGAMMHALLALAINWTSEEFSLAGETLVTVRTDHEFEISLENLYSSVQQGLSLETLQVRAVEGNTVGWYPVTDVMQHHTGHKAAYEVITEDGSVVATEDHSLFRYNLGTGLIVEIPTKDLRVGDLLAFATGSKVSGAIVHSVCQVLPLQVSYDLSVPGPQNFVLSNGMVAHNSYSIGGISLDLDKSSKYQSLYDSVKSSWDEQLDRAKRTVKIVKGLQQSRYGIGIRSAFGPYSGAGQLTPRAFVGF